MTMTASGVFSLVGGRKTPPAQVAQCQDHLGHKYRSGMLQPNADSTRARSALRWCPCASCIWLLHPAPILVPKMVLTLFGGGGGEFLVVVVVKCISINTPCIMRYAMGLYISTFAENLKNLIYNPLNSPYFTVTIDFYLYNCSHFTALGSSYYDIIIKL